MNHRMIMEKWHDKYYLEHLACDADVGYWATFKWYERNSIPQKHWKAVVEAARRRKIRGVTLQVLAEAKDE